MPADFAISFVGIIIIIIIIIVIIIFNIYIAQFQKE